MKQLLRLGITICILLLGCTTASRAQQPSGPAGLQNGLVAWLQLDEQAGTRALDASGSGKSARLVNGGNWHPWGKVRGSVRLLNDAALQIPLQWQPSTFTVGWWVYADGGGTITNYSQAVGGDLDGNGWGSFLFHASSDGRIYVGTDIATRIVTPQYVLQANSWHHFVFTFDRGEAALHVYRTGDNQRLTYTRSGMTMPTPWRMLSIGSTTNPSLRASGYYDDVRVYDRAISVSEVAQLTASTTSVYTPPANPADDFDRNWSTSRSYDGSGNVVGESKSFADGLGRSTQAQVKSQTTGHVLATQTVYSSGGKPVLSTLTAPINNTEFSYKQNFITAKSSGTDYSATNFEGANSNNPTAVNQPTTPGSVGYYYSTNNTLEPLTATTNYPFSLMEEYGGPLGGVKRATGPGDSLRMGLGREGKGREFPLLNELDHYLSLRPQFIAGRSASSLRLKGEKAVNVNVNGIESLSFSDADGKLLATCLSGAQYPGLTLTGYVHSDPNNSGNIPVFQDLHVPAAGPVTLTIGGTGRIRIINLLTEAVSNYTAPWPAISLTPGFYRLISENDNQSFSYLARYGEFSYSYYDDAGRAVATVAPRGLTQGLTQENQVKNASFDLDTGPVSAPKFWETLGDANAVYTETYGGAHSGTYHGTHYHGGSNYYAFTHQVITGLPNGRYTLRAWVKSSGGQSKAYLLARNFGGGLQYVPAPPSPNGTHGEWTLLELKDLQVSNGQCDIGFESQANPGQYFFFDDVEFFRQPDDVAPQFVTRNTYSGAGTMLATESTDEGRTEYVYARDGRIRFSQSALQKQQDRFSYSNYDDVGRVVESGEYQMSGNSYQGHVFTNQLPKVVAYEAEDMASSSGRATNWPGYRGTGFVGDLTSQGTYISFVINVPLPGRYPVLIRYASGLSGADRTMATYVNNQNVSPTTFPVTNSWATWTTQIIDLELGGGNNTIRLQHNGGSNDGWINIDYIEVTENKTPTGNSVLALLEERMPFNSLDPTRCSQRNQVWYDEPVQDADLNGRTQDFVLGAVTKTSNGTNTTWYSYDELGRLMWLAQKAPGVGVKFVDYSYDLTGNVLQVAYQKDQSDAFYHHYAYDADRRLRTVHTSSDGTSANQTLQARYFYYLHGPLKRVEIADRLQGIDYAYTVQGWLKSINNSRKSLDPGQDSPGVNGTLKDLFGMRLDYFDNDYASRQIAATNLYLPLNSKERRYDGTVRAASWQTAAADKMHGYGYRYDTKGQLLESVYGEFIYGGGYFNYNNTTRPYAEDNLSYDTHGNILTLRRNNGTGTPLDNFNYEYAASTNKLTTVKNQSNQPVLSYEYDVIGQMTRESETGKGDKFLSYDVTGKVTDVYRDASRTTRLASYAYNDRGFRASKVVYSPQGVAQNTTHYVTDAQGNVLSTYEQAANQALTRTEVPLYGASRLGTLTRLNKRANTADTLETHYELNDQLGNARVIFRKPTTKKYLATMNIGQASNEEAQFDNLPATRRQDAGRAYDDTYVAALNGVAEGPKKRLAVEKGDTVTFSAQALYFGAVIGRPSMLRIAPLATTTAVLAPMPGLPGAGSIGPDGSRTKPNLLGRVALGISVTGLASKLQEQTTITTTLPAQLIRYRFYNENNELKAEGTRYVSNGPDSWQQLQLGFRVPDAGTIELTTLNQSFEYATYFDHIEVEHTSSSIVQEQHQYAFGSPITGLNYTVGTKRYRHGYQGQFAEKDDETGYDSFELRLYNSRIGRWTAPDPEGQFNSPYVGMGNNPLSNVDSDGGWSFGPNVLKGALVGGAIGAGVVGVGAWATGHDWKQGALIGFGMGAAAGGYLGGTDYFSRGARLAGSSPLTSKVPTIPSSSIIPLPLSLEGTPLSIGEVIVTGYNFLSDPFGGEIRPSSLFGAKRAFDGGRPHPGSDYPANKGAIQRATAPGTAFVGFNELGYGNFVMIDHGPAANGPGNIWTLYGHGMPGGVMVKNGQQVSTGQPILKTGSTGFSTGNHAHYEVIKTIVSPHHKGPFRKGDPRINRYPPSMLPTLLGR